MRRLTPFERDFADLHGTSVLREVRIEIVNPAPGYSPSRLIFGIGLGLVSLFWIIVLATVLGAGAFGLWAILS